MLTDVGTRYNGMELSPERVAAFFSIITAKHNKQPLPLAPPPKGGE